MRRLLTGCVLCVLTVVVGRVWGEVAFMKLDDVRPGMKGVMRTVFEGTKVEAVPAEVVDVLRGIAPGRDVIIVRLTGERIRATGVARGMSGSPIYVDGKVIGALSFAWPYLKEPVAGLTPIEQMMRVKEAGVEPKADARALTWNPAEPIPSERLIARVLSPKPAALLVGPAGMSVLKTPIGLSGFSKRSADVLGEHLRAFDVAVVQAGGAGARVPPGDVKLEAGGTICVQLIRGDLDATAVGTVCEIDGTRVYALGHPMMDSGRIDLPMAAGRIHIVVPSEQISFKIGSADRLVGTVTLDHAAGIVGEIGDPPAMLPVTVDMLRRDVASETRYRFEVVRDRRVALSLVNAALTGLADVAGKPDTDVQIAVSAVIDVAGHDPVAIRQVYAGPQAPVAATGALVQPLGHILHNPFEPVEVRSLRVTAEVTPDDTRAVIRYAETDRNDYRPGEEVDVAVTLQPWRGKIVIRHCRIRLPDDLPEGKLTLVVCDPATDARMESGEMPHRSRPEDLAGVLDFFRRERPSTEIVFRLSKLTPGMALEGRELPDLPESILSVLGKQPPIGVARFTAPVVTRVPTEFVILGRQQVEIEIVKD